MNRRLNQGLKCSRQWIRLRKLFLLASYSQTTWGTLRNDGGGLSSLLAGSRSSSVSAAPLRKEKKGLLYPALREIAVTVQMSGTSGQCPELPDQPGTSTLKVLKKHFGVRAKPLGTLMDLKGIA